MTRLLFLLLALPLAAGDEPASVAVRRGTLRSFTPAIGSFRAHQKTQLGSQVSGRVQEVLVDVGDIVRAGQVLVRIDPVFFQIEVAQRQADLEAAKVTRTDAELNFTRMRNLWEKPEGGAPSIPQKSYDDSKAHLDEAAARERQAEQALQYAGGRLKETEIRAPYDAVVTARMVDPGEPVTSAPIVYLVEVQEVARLDLEFSLPQEMLSRIQPGTAVGFDVEGVEGIAGEGPIERVYPTVDEATRSFRCRVLVDNGAGRYRPGLLARVRVAREAREGVLILPETALTPVAGGWEVVLDNEKKEHRAIRVGLETEEEVEVLEGLSEGERVMAHERSGTNGEK